MFNSTKVIVVLSMLFSTIILADVPIIISHQGRITVGGTNFTGDGLFKFAFVRSSENGGTMLWSNSADTDSDGTPDEAITITVQDGLYSILLGDTSIVGMSEIDPTIFTNLDVYLRIWFNDGTTGWEQLSPDQRIAAAGYAIQASQINGKVNSTTDGNLTVAGKLGINTSDPEYKFEIHTSSNAKSYYTTSTGDDSEIYHEFILNTRINEGDRNYLRFSHGGNVKASIYSQSNQTSETATLNLINHSASGITFSTNGQNQRMLIASDGKVGINTSSPETQLHVDGVVTATNIVTTSDKRFKQDIQPIPNALNMVSKLNGVSYNWQNQSFPEKNFPTTRQLGVIAQDVEKVIPEVVSTDSKGSKAVNYQSLTPVLIEAIKEQQDTIKKQNDKIEALSRKLELMEQKLNRLK